MAQDISKKKKEELIEMVENLAEQIVDMQDGIEKLRDLNETRRFDLMRKFYSIGGVACAILHLDKENPKLSPDMKRMVNLIKTRAYAPIDSKTNKMIKDILRKERLAKEKAAREAKGEPEPQQVISQTV